MSSSRRRGLITRLRNAAQKLEEERMLARHRLEIDNDQALVLANASGAMRDAVSLLEKL